MSKVVVFGATGYAGGHIAAELIRRGYDVVGVARDTSSLVTGEHLSPAQGSLFDAEFVRRVAEGAEVLVVALPFREIDGHRLVDAMGSLLDTAAAVGARLGVVGGAGSLRVAEDGPRLFETPEFPTEFVDEARAAGAALEALQAAETEVDWFFLSPAALFGSYNPGAATGHYRLGDEVLVTDESGRSDISGADYALAFVDEIAHPAHHQARFTVGY